MVQHLKCEPTTTKQHIQTAAMVQSMFSLYDTRFLLTPLAISARKRGLGERELGAAEGQGRNVFTGHDLD